MANRILITGGTGYLGGRIAAHLALNPGNELILTSRTAGTAPAYLPSGKVVKLDLQDDASVKDVCKNIDVVIHLAALNEIESAQNPQKALLVNGGGTLKLLEDAEKNGVKKFIYLSTAHIYKAPLAGVIDEETLPKPVHPYAITHKVAEDFVLAAKLQGIVVRLSNGFGYPASASVNRWTLLTNDLCKQAVMQRTLVLKSTGLQSRDFVTLTDVGRAMEHFIGLPANKTGDGIFNLGGKNSRQIIEMAHIVADRCEQVLGFRPAISHPPAGPGEKAPEQVDFRIDKLEETGFRLAGDMYGEIDQTLILCNQSFNQNNA